MVLSVLLARQGAACSIPTQIHLFSIPPQNHLYSSCRSLLALLAAGSCWASQLRGAGTAASPPVCPAVSPARAKPGSVKPFSPYLVSFAIVWAAKTITKERFNLNNPAHTQREERSGKKKSPQLLLPPRSEQRKERWHCLYSTSLRQVIFSEVSREHLPHFTACEAYHLEPF